jgi:hypothetical protein
MFKKAYCAYQSALENKENIISDYYISQSTVMNHLQLFQRSSLPSALKFLVHQYHSLLLASLVGAYQGTQGMGGA